MVMVLPCRFLPLQGRLATPRVELCSPYSSTLRFWYPVDGLSRTSTGCMVGEDRTVPVLSDDTLNTQHSTLH